MRCPNCGYAHKLPYKRQGERRARVMDILRQNPVMNAKALAYAVYGDDYHPDDAAVKLRGVIYQMVRAGIKVEHVTGLGRNGNGYRLL